MHSNLCLLALLSLLLVGCSSASDEAMSTVSSSGLASIEVKPDKATISFEVLVFSKDSAAATNELSSVSQNLQKFFTTREIPSADVKAQDIEKFTVRRTDDNGKELEILGYEIRRSFSITLTDLKKFETIMRDLYAMPSITTLNAEFENSEQNKHEAELLQKACAQARAEAEQLAKGFGARLGSVHRISKEPIHERTMFASDLEKVTEIRDIEPIFYPPATVHLSQSVSAIFELKN